LSQEYRVTLEYQDYFAQSVTYGWPLHSHPVLRAEMPVL
jgi:hypothetical protein